MNIRNKLFTLVFLKILSLPSIPKDLSFCFKNEPIFRVATLVIDLVDEEESFSVEAVVALLIAFIVFWRFWGLLKVLESSES